MLVMNAGGYAVRLFYAYYQCLPSKEDQVGMMEVVCEQITECMTDPRDQGMTLELDHKNMTWLSVDRVVWDDIIGEEAAKRALVKLVGPPMHPRYFNHYCSTVEYYFRPGSMTESVVRWLKVPPESMRSLMGAHQLRAEAELLDSDGEQDTS
jgi:hypothetical protein